QPEDSTFKIGICDVDKGSFISMPFEEKEANAKLIAAAPIMFNALKKLIEVYEDKGQLLAFNVSIAKEAIEAALGEEQQWKR
ncbi:hypothetical protein, partial [Sphingobacterium mizutaii]|uniref:hypothetical protein n=1 Tax=Sphingobacterium mizutaii TaxID=1010 RepID=UPI00289C5700